MSGIKLTAEFILILIAIVVTGQKTSEKTSKYDTSIESYTVPVEIHSDELPNSQFRTEVEKDRSTESIKETTEIDRVATEQSNTYTMEDKLTTEIERDATEQSNTYTMEDKLTTEIDRNATEQSNTYTMEDKLTTEIDRDATEQRNTYTMKDKLTTETNNIIRIKSLTETEDISKTVTEQASKGKIPETEETKKETVAQTTIREPETKTVISFEIVTNVEPTQVSTVTETLLRTTSSTDADLFAENSNTNEDRTASFEELDYKMDSSEDLNYYQELLSTRRMMMHGNDQQNVILDTKMRNAEVESVEPIYSASAPVNNVNNFLRNRLGTVPVVNKQGSFPQFFPAVTRPGYFYKPEFIKSAAPLFLTKIVEPDLRTVIKTNTAAISRDPLPSNLQSIEDFNINISDNAYLYLPMYDNKDTKSIQSPKFKTNTRSSEDFSKLTQENPSNDVFAKLVEASKHPTGEVIKKYGNVPDNILNRRIIGFTQDHNIGYSQEILARALQQRLVQKGVLPYFLQ